MRRRFGSASTVKVDHMTIVCPFGYITVKACNGLKRPIEDAGIGNPGGSPIGEIPSAADLAGITTIENRGARRSEERDPIPGRDRSVAQPAQIIVALRGCYAAL